MLDLLGPMPMEERDFSPVKTQTKRNHFREISTVPDREVILPVVRLPR